MSVVGPAVADAQVASVDINRQQLSVAVVLRPPLTLLPDAEAERHLSREPGLDLRAHELRVRVTRDQSRLHGQPALVGLGFVAGLPRGRGRVRREAHVVELAARSLALRASGLSPAGADDQAANEWNANRPRRYWTRPSDIGVYRLRVRRDRSR